MDHRWKGITSWEEYLWPVRVLLWLGKLPCRWDFHLSFLLASGSIYFLCVGPWVEVIWCLGLSLRTEVHITVSLKVTISQRSVVQVPLQSYFWSSEQLPGSYYIHSDQAAVHRYGPCRDLYQRIYHTLLSTSVSGSSLFWRLCVPAQ